MQKIDKIFLKMETKENLFNLQLSNGVYYWDIIRRNVYLRIAYYLKKNNKSLNDQDYIKSNFKIKNYLKIKINMFSKKYIISKKPDYIFTTFQKISGSKYQDLIADHIIDSLPKYSLCIEHMNTSKINYLQMIIGSKTRVPPLFLIYKKSNKEIFDISNHIEKIIKLYFDVSIKLANIINYSINEFLQKKAYFDDLFSKFKPKAIFVNDDGSYKSLYFSALNSNIPTIELQHGISDESILYNYPKYKKKDKQGLYLPKYFFFFFKYF